MNPQTNQIFENVVIISLDCVRREALGCYPQHFPWQTRFLGASKTPNIDNLCARGHRFDQVITHAPFTPAAHASLLTGLIPPKHGIRKFLGAKLSKDAKTLAELLSAKGWQCGAVVGAQALSNEFGFKRGFHYYDDDIQTGMKAWKAGERRDAPEVTDRTINWLNSVKKDDPFFLFVHYFDAHNLTIQPNTDSSQKPQTQSPTGFRQQLRQKLPAPVQAVLRPADQAARSTYYASRRAAEATLDQGLSYFEAGGKYKYEGRRFMLNQMPTIDAQIGRLVETLTNQGKLDKTLIILLADHGDDFMEHGEPTHRKYLYDTTLLVPLIIYPQLGPRSVIKSQARLIDVFPTVLSALGVESNQEIDGESLIELIHEDSGSGQKVRKAYSETIFELFNDNHEVDILSCYASLRVDPYKLIWNRLDDTFELYLIDKDPGETNNRIKDNFNLQSTMSAELRLLAQDMPISLEESDDLVLIERLEALGYL